MSRGSFKQPPPGPEIGPTKEFDKLPEEKKRELGDLNKAAEDVFKPAKLDPRVAAAEEMQYDASKEIEKQRDPNFDVGTRSPLMDDERVREAAEKMAAMQKIAEEDRQQDEDDLRSEALPTDEDKQEFLRSVLGNRRYQKTYDLFGGQLSVTMIELTPQEEDQIFSALAVAQSEGKILTEDSWMLFYERMRMAYSVKKVAGGPTSYSRDPDAEDLDVITVDSLPEYVNRFKGATTFRAIMQVSRLFRTQMELMLEASLAPDFWTTAGPDSQSKPTTEESSTTAVNQSPDRGSTSKL
jgi:hypothetical protein